MSNEAFDKWYARHDALSEYSARQVWKAAKEDSAQEIARLKAREAYLLESIHKANKYANSTVSVRNILNKIIKEIEAENE